MNYSQFEVHEVPLVEDDALNGLVMHAGQLEITEKGSKLFFWDFQHDSRSNRPLVIWLNGGPGCSSMDGALMEVGPLRVEGNVVRFNKGWFEMADLVFIDQPLATGFSIKDKEDEYDMELTTSTQRLMTFLDKYLTMLGDSGVEYQDIIIGGESYAGQYIPHLARSLKDSQWGNKLKAISMGNAWLDPNLQSLSFIPFSILNGIIDPQQDESKLSRLLTQQDQCQNKINSDKDIKFVEQSCDSILTNLLSKFTPENHKCYNVYDISKIDSYPACGNNWPETLNDVVKYLNLPDVQRSLNIDRDIQWKECNNDLYHVFKPSKGTSELGANLLSGLLHDGIKVQLFSGVNDLICNYLSTEMVIKQHLKEFMGSTIDKRGGGGIETFDMDYNWQHEKEMAGEAWIRGNLSYVKVNDASHMVAYDFSERSIGLLDMILNDIKPENGTLLTGKREQEKNENSSQPSGTEYSPFRRYISLTILILIFTGLGYYLVKSVWNEKQYSSLSKGNRSKKKRVHWRDLEQLGDDEEEENEEEDQFAVEVELNDLDQVEQSV